MKLTRLVPLMILLLCTASLNALGKAKTDVITLYNGDRITGEIKSLESGILKLSTDAMGTVRIEWADVARLESDYFYEIRLSDGARHLGSIETPELSGQVTLLDLDGEHDTDSLNVVSIRPIEKTLVDRLDIYFSAGYSYNRASSVSQTSLNTTIGYENEKSRNTLTGRATTTDSDTETTTSSRVDLDRAVWTRYSNVFRSVFSNYETNDELGLDHRVGVGAGLGRIFSQSQRSRLAGVAGLQLITEESKNEGSDQNLEIYLSSRFLAWRLDSPELDLDFGLNLYPSVTDSGRLRGSSDLRLRWELFEDLFFDITAYGSYDNRADSSSGVDYGVTTGLGWEF